MTNKLTLNIIRTPADVQSWGFVGDLLITFSVEGQIPDTRMITLYEEMRSAKPKAVLGLSVRRVTLTSLQRKRAKEEFSGFSKNVVVLDDPITRGIITAVGWLGLNVKSFAWSGLREACEHVAPSGLNGDQVSQALEEIRRQHLAVLGETGASVA